MLKISDLTVSQYMTAYPLSVLPEISLFETISFMARRGIGNIIVTKEDGTPLGILTEREILERLAFHKTLPNIQVSEIKLQKFEKLTPDISIYEAAKTLFSKKARLLVFSEHDHPVGIITASDLLRAFRKTDYSPSISDVISKKIYMCAYNDKILDAVELMHKKRIGSVIIERLEDNYGIFTERDLIFKVLNNKVQLTEKLNLYSTYPLATAEEGISAKEAASIMSAKNIKRLALIKNDDIVGIVTARDLVDAYCHHVSDLIAAE
jgi:CBS domain-containing protein